MTKRKDPKKKLPAGRPPVTLNDLTENWRDVMHDTYREGGGDAEVKVSLAIFPGTGDE